MTDLSRTTSTENILSEDPSSSDGETEKYITTTQLPFPKKIPDFKFQLLGPVGEKLIRPASLAVSNSGEIVVSDSESCFIVIYGSHGNYLSHFSTIPKKTFYMFFSIEGYKPHDVDWLSNKRVAFTQPKGCRIVISDWTGKYHVTIEGRPLYEPYGIKVDNSDHIYVTDRHKGRILCFNSDGKLLQTIGKFGCSNISLTVPHYIQFSNNEEDFYVNHIFKGKSVISLFKRDGKLKHHLYPDACSKTADRELGHFVVTSNGSILVSTDDTKHKASILVMKTKSKRDTITNGHVKTVSCVSKLCDMGFPVTAVAINNANQIACINSELTCIQIHSLMDSCTDSNGLL